MRAVIANILPGVREARTPLLVGYVWAVALWLVVSDAVPRASSPGVIADLFDLSNFFGKTALITASSLAAYLIGALLTVDSQSCIVATLLTKLPRRFNSSNDPRLTKDLSRFLAYKLDGDAPTARNVLAQDLGSLPTKLMAESERLFDHFDRMSSEATLRLSLAPALACLTGVALWRQSISLQSLPAWAIGIFAVSALLLVQGLAKRRAANDILLQAVITETIPTASVEAALERKALKKREEERKIAELNATIEKNATKRTDAERSTADRSAADRSSERLTALELKLRALELKARRDPADVSSSP